MFSIIMLLLAVILFALGLLTWEQGAKGYWVWFVLFTIPAFLYVSGIHS